jgi:hypothetical protein
LQITCGNNEINQLTKSNPLRGGGEKGQIIRSRITEFKEEGVFLKNERTQQDKKQ